jgi:CheY-like chemotaxis protein
MPEMDGFAAAKALRGDDRTSSLIIVALTAHDRRYVEARASEEDFDGYCQKGLMLEPLIDLLSDLTRTTTEPENGE